MPATESALFVDDLHKSYGDVDAVRGLSFSMPRGAVLGLLGTNGAGKTTTIRAVSTLVPFDRGVVRVLGRDVGREPRTVRSLIGVTGQYAALDGYLTARENLEMIGRLQRLRAGDARRRAGDLLDAFDLAGAVSRRVDALSGGMRRRLDIAASLVVVPELLILDEPTTGLDPRSRRTVHALIRDLVCAGTSVLLCTQYLEEADGLADDIVVMDNGAAIAQGPPDALKDQVGGMRIEVRLTDDRYVARAVEVLERIGSSAAHVDADRRLVTVPARKGPRLLARTVRELDESTIGIEDVGLREPTLDEAFLALTGAQSAMVGSASARGMGGS